MDIESSLSREKVQIHLSHYETFLCAVVSCHGAYVKLFANARGVNVECHWHRISTFKAYREEVLTLWSDRTAADRHHVCADVRGLLSAFWVSACDRDGETFEAFVAGPGREAVSKMFEDAFGLPAADGVAWLSRRRLVDAFLHSLPAA